MPANHDIEVEFDEVSQDYYAIWEPPVAIGSGKTELEALRDLQDVAHFGIASFIVSRGEKDSSSVADKKDNQIENQETSREKARKIVAFLPKENCGKCGFNGCGEFAMAVLQGHASPYGCHKQPSSGAKISEIMGTAIGKEEEQCTLNRRSHHLGLSAKRHHRSFGRGILFRHIHQSKHHHG